MSRPMHVATVAHEGHIWDAYLEFEDDPQRPGVFRARLRFDRADHENGREVVRTTVIIIEETYDRAVEKARSFDDRQLAGLLRSALPNGDE